MSTAARVRRAAGVAGLLLLATGCSQLGPGTASVVDGERITVAEVDALTAAQCDLAAQQAVTGQGQVFAISTVKQSILGALIETTLNEQFAEDLDVTPSPELVEEIVAQAVPPAEGESAEAFNDFQERYIVSQLALAQAGADGAGEELTTQNIAPAFELGQRQLEEWRADREVVTDARYAPDAEGLPATGTGSGSVSQAASAFAVQGSAAEPDPDYVASLPASQRCGG